jgi:hypothetical protein
MATTTMMNRRSRKSAIRRDAAAIDRQLRAVARRAEKAAQRLADRNAAAARLCLKMAELARLARQGLTTAKHWWDDEGRAVEIRRLVGVVSRMLPVKGGAFLERIKRDVFTALGHCRDCWTYVYSLDEYYMTSDTVWAASGLGPEDGNLCLGCLARRIGRDVRDEDCTRLLYGAWSKYPPPSEGASPAPSCAPVQLKWG